MWPGASGAASVGPARRWAGEDAQDAPENAGGGGKNRGPQGTTAGATRWQNNGRRGSWEATGLGYLFPAGTSLSGEATGNSCGTQPPSVLGGHWPELGKRCCIYIGLASPAALHLLCCRYLHPPPACQCRRCKRLRYGPWIWKIPRRRKLQPTPVFSPGKPHGQRSLADYSPWGRSLR